MGRGGSAKKELSSKQTAIIIAVFVVLALGISFTLAGRSGRQPAGSGEGPSTADLESHLGKMPPPPAQPGGGNPEGALGK